MKHIRFKKLKHEIPTFESSTSEFEIAAFVDQAAILKRPSAVLAFLLDERSAFYSGRGSNEVFRIQGYIMASLERYGLEAEAMPIVLETLESSQNIYMVAAAAKAIRGMQRPNAQMAPYLLSAIDNIYFRDDTISFACYAPRWPLSSSTTALKEIFYTFQWLAPIVKEVIPKLETWLQSNKLNRANRDLLAETITVIKQAESKREDCCDLPLSSTPIRTGVSWKQLRQIPLEDQDGNKLHYRDFFQNQPTVLVFFYTRCNNHNKCSLTINKLGKLQKSIKERGWEGQVKTAAISYDPAFDSPEYLKHYGLQRHQHFDAFNRSFRVLDFAKMPLVLKFFNSSVNYFGQLVNKHQVELHILNSKGIPVKSFVRQQWDPAEVLEAVELYLARSNNKWKIFAESMTTSTLTAGLPLLIAFFPKCPLCWAAYLSLFGIAGVSSIPYSPWVLPVLAILLTINLWLLWRRAAKRKIWPAFYFSVAGTILLILFGTLFPQMKSMVALGLILIVSGSLLNSLSDSVSLKLADFTQVMLQNLGLGKK